MKTWIIFLFITLVSCTGQKKEDVTQPHSKFPVQKTDAEWRAQLTPAQYDVLRNKGTERPHIGAYVETFDEGIYVCAGCDAKLFDSDHKFDTHCGWPSFDRAIKGSVIYEADFSHGMERTEVMCASCGGHLGHVFDDGPQQTTGNRYCTNSVAIKFIPAKK